MPSDEATPVIDPMSRLLSIVSVAGAGVILTLIIGFIADVRSEQSDMRSRFEERTRQAKSDIERINAELERARNSRTNMREIFSRQQALVAALDVTDERVLKALADIRMQVNSLAIELTSVDKGQAERLNSLQIQINRVFHIMQENLTIRGESPDPDPQYRNPQ